MKKAMRLLLVLLCALNIYLLFYVILFKFSPVRISTLIQHLQLVITHPSLSVGHFHSANFIPFYTINSSLTANGGGAQWLNLYGNIFIFIPTGVLVACMLSRQRVTSAVLVSFLLSLLLESMQLFLLMGSFDVDDLILNTLGGTLGAVGASIMLMLRKHLTVRKLKQLEN